MNSYESNPNFIKAMEFIKSHDLNSLETGKHEIDGDNVFLKIVDSELRPKEAAKLEVHDKYIDIQIPLSCAESFGIKKRELCSSPVGTMNVEKDILFYADPVEEIISVEAGEIAVFAPDMAHAPLIGVGPVHKAIFKVKA